MLPTDAANSRRLPQSLPARGCNSFFLSSAHGEDVLWASDCTLLPSLTAGCEEEASLVKRPKQELSVYGPPLPRSRFFVIPIHPLADERDLLARLDMRPRPDQCLLCDVYWLFSGDIYFVSVDAASAKNPFVSFHIQARDFCRAHFYVVIARQPIDTVLLETVLTFLAKWIREHPSAFRKTKQGKATHHC